MAVKFTKSINYNPNYPTFIKVAEETSNAVKGNNGKWYLSEEHFSQLNEGEYLIEHLTEDLFTPPVVKVWSKKEYEEFINDAHTAWFRQLYTAKPYDYSSFSEILAYVGDDTYDAEARSFIQLWKDSVEILYSHIEIVTEETALTVEQFLNSLPKFNH